MPLALCLARAGATTVVAASQFSLSWTHSIEKIRWEELWRITPAGLVVEEARIQGHGAGMEPPEGAVLRDGVWHYHPQVPPQPEVVLAASDFTADHTLCAEGRCQPLHQWIAGDGPVHLSRCEAP